MNVIVEPHKPIWTRMYSCEVTSLRTLIGPDLVQAHHIGSTAVPGIWAKPIIDILLEVRSVERLDGFQERFLAHGYQPMGEYGIKGRRYFRKNSPEGRRTHHIHAYQAGDEHVTRHLAFRDFLIAHSEESERYSLLKRKLADDHPDDMRRYVEGKEPFIRDLELRALEWART